MRQGESKMFPEILNRLREGNHTPSDLKKLKERCVEESECPTEAPRLFIQNALVDEYNNKVYQSFDSVSKYTIKAHDSVIGVCSTELKEKIMRQIPYVPLKNSKQLAHKLNIAVGQRTEIAINVRTDDCLTNGASNVIANLLDSFGFNLITMMLEREPDKKIETFTQEVYEILGLLSNLLQRSLL